METDPSKVIARYLDVASGEVGSGASVLAVPLHPFAIAPTTCWHILLHYLVSVPVSHLGWMLAMIV